LEPEKHDDYSVKSAYRKLDATRICGDEFMPGGSGDDSWKRIWKLSVSPKVKVFWCRVLHEFLLAKDILNQRQIELTAFCDLCAVEREFIKHILA
jgi:hypothetical protein